MLFLDEPTTGPDRQSRTELWAVIRELVGEGATVLLTTQYLEEADRLADRIAVVDHGHIVANDKAGALKARPARSVVEMGFADESEGGRAEEVLTGRVPGRLTRESSTLRLAVHDGPGLLVDLLRVLDDRALVPVSLMVREPSLDEVFLVLTGGDGAGFVTMSAAAGVADGLAAGQRAGSHERGAS